MKLPLANKNCEIGEYIVAANLPEINEEGYANWRIEPAKIVKVVNLTDAEYDEFVENLMENRDFLLNDGGNESNDPRLDKFETFNEVMNDKEAFEIYKETAYSIVHAIEAPTKKHF